MNILFKVSWWMMIGLLYAVLLPGRVSATISNLAQLDRQANKSGICVESMLIEGTVWWSSEAEGRIILQDETAALQLELDLPCKMPEQGDRLRIEGDCTFVKTRDFIKLTGVPVVENGGLHPPEERTGTTFLESGRHPIRVLWFNRTERHGLEVRYEGPGISLQPIPDAALSHPEYADGTTNFIAGLNYRCCEGPWWSHLPNFDHMAAVKTGTVNNFDISIWSRTNHVGILFEGFIEIPQDGDYTFHVSSDDGSRLFIGDSTLQIKTVGHEELLTADPATMTDDRAEAEYQWSEIQGIVTSFHRSRGALQVDLMVGADQVRLWVAEDSDASYTLRPQNRIRAVGVGRRIRNLDGAWIFGDFFTQHWNDIEQQNISLSIWNEYPVLGIGQLTTDMIGSVVHLNGTLKPTGNRQMVLEDPGGQIILSGAIPDGLEGRSSDVLGLLSMEGTNWVLRAPHFHRLGASGTEADSLPVLTTAEQVGQLSFEEAARGYPVRLRGVITSPNQYEGAVLQDATRGVYLWLPKPDDMSDEEWRPIAVQSGDYCEVEGVTAPYQFNPYVRGISLKKLGAGAFPIPVKPSWDQLINGSMHCNYVELEGVAASIGNDTVTLLTRDGRINIRLNPIGPPIPPDAQGATIRMHGSLLADWDGDTRQAVIGSIYLDQHSVTVIQPAPADPFSIPLKRVGDLLQFDPQAGALQRIRISGILIYQDGQSAYLMDDEHGLRFLPAEPLTAQIGDEIEVVGFADLNGASPLVRDAIARPTGERAPLQPRRLEPDDLLRDEYDSTLVLIDGVLLGVSKRHDGTVLEVQNGLRRFLAVVKNAAGLDESLSPGSELELTGVYVGQGGNRVLGKPIDSFELLLGSAQDVRVLSNPPWWTLRRMLMVVSVLFGILFASLIWINLLHRKVEQRTQELGDQIQKRERAERQRELEQERARLAHDLHDDLGAGLTEANMLATLINSPAISSDEKVRCADEMNDLLLRMVMSLDEIVWAENPRNDTISSLAGYLAAHAQRLLDLADVGCGLEMENLPEESLDPKFRQELFLAFKEAITNVVQHAAAKKVWLRIAIENDDLVITVSDDGCGLRPADQAAGADGLINMSDRMAALGGSCTIQSRPGEGTSVRLQAPIQRVET
ncbi:MAG: hypothetical protein JXR25_10110 [Pontiellaceae bacterium]|nr:hypothetical protein [Pontiellaceae bacterium]MBN2785172.1 hypothetical protein [Pontiellaceae bacterium]